jgi:biotin carboxylase
MSIGDKLTPIAESFTLKDYTFTVLRAAILEMDIYGPDVDLRLDERKLAEKLGISRTPIREALARLERALSELIVDGVDTTIPLFPALLAEPDIQAGTYNIHWLERWLESNLAD